MNRQKEPGHGGPLGPLTLLRELPVTTAARSDHLGWSSLVAARYRSVPAAEFRLPATTHHAIFLFVRPPERLELAFEGVKRHVPPPAGSVSLMPNGGPCRGYGSGRMDSVVIFLDPGLLARVAAEAFDLDPARLALPPLDGLDLPDVRAAMMAVDAELTAGGRGGPLAAESLANVLAVRLLRHVLAPRRPPRRRSAALPRAKLRAVVEYVEEHLAGHLSLGQMAALTRLSPNYFASQFKRATGLSPHQFVILRRVERARRLLEAGGSASLAEVAAQVGFSDQSQFSHHFKRRVGHPPGRYRRA